MASGEGAMRVYSLTSMNSFTQAFRNHASVLMPKQSLGLGISAKYPILRRFMSGSYCQEINFGKLRLFETRRHCGNTCILCGYSYRIYTWLWAIGSDNPLNRELSEP